MWQARKADRAALPLQSSATKSSSDRTRDAGRQKQTPPSCLRTTAAAGQE